MCRYNNITRASVELFVSQPAISASIKELEDELGVSLFHRQNNKIALTMEGTYFLKRADEILADADLLLLQMKDFGGKKNHFRIGIPPMIGTFLFPPMFRGFKEAYPEIDIEMIEYGSLQTRVLVEDESIDLAITIVEDGMEDKFNIIELLMTELVFCVNDKHPLAKLKSVSVDDLDDQPLILMKADSYQNPKIKDMFAKHNRQPHVLLYSSQLYTIKNFLLDGTAGAFLFKEVAAMEKEMVSISLKEPIKIRIGLIWKKEKHLFSDTEKFVHFATNYKYKQEK